jgi:LSD1 subclass zinc finger protein
MNNVKLSDPTQPPREGVKYVCCGSCRQWLLAPKDAMLVACSRCEAINNCALLNETRVRLVSYDGLILSKVLCFFPISFPVFFPDTTTAPCKSVL